MIGAQSGLFYWKKRHKRSYELVRTWLTSMLAYFVLSHSLSCSHSGDTAWPLAGACRDQCIHDLVEVCPGKLECQQSLHSVSVVALLANDGNDVLTCRCGLATLASQAT